MFGDPVPVPRLSVILCTYNPRPDLLARALRALGNQTLHPDAFELVVVDNNSPVPVRAEVCERLALREIRVVRELRQGLTFARVAGIEATSAPVICFVDDDNELTDDYLARVLEIADSESQLGVWGGRCHGALESRIGPIKRRWLPHLGVRDEGTEALTGDGDSWGPHEPIGAGICVRRLVAEGYVAFVESEGGAGSLGRKGTALLSGEDSLMSRIANRLGYLVGYRPQLQLFHHITASRLKFGYLTRLMNGHGRSYVVLQRLCGAELKPLDKPERRVQLWKNFWHRLREQGLNEAVGMFFWDRGYQSALCAPTVHGPSDELAGALQSTAKEPRTYSSNIAGRGIVAT